MDTKPIEDSEPIMGAPSIGRCPKGQWVASVIARGGLFVSRNI